MRMVPALASRNPGIRWAKLGLAGPGRSHQRRNLAYGQRQVDVAQRLATVGIAHANAGHLNAAVDRTQRRPAARGFARQIHEEEHAADSRNVGLDANPQIR